MDFSKKLKEIISCFEISINQFKERTGIDTRSVYTYFNGEGVPTLKNLMKIIEVFPEISLEWLLRDSGPMLLKELEVQPDPAVSDQKENPIDEVTAVKMDYLKKENNRLEVANQELRNRVSRLETKNDALEAKILSLV